MQIVSGNIPLLNDTAIKDRFQQVTQLARELLADFREVEHNFRSLDRRVRERIALRKGAKGHLLREIMGERDAIAESDQGRSFRAFWDFLMSSSRQEELSALLDRILALPPVAELKPDMRLRRMHYDWLEAGGPGGGPAGWWPKAYLVIDDIALPKQGKLSVGVARQYCGQPCRAGELPVAGLDDAGTGRGARDGWAAPVPAR